MATETKYAQVKLQLTDFIRAHCSVGSRIPSTETLHETFGVSRATVNRAIRDLVQDGLLERHRRKGTFVARGNKNRCFMWPVLAEEDWSDRHRDAIMRGIEREAQSRGEHIMVRGIGTGSKLSFGGPQGIAMAGVLMAYNLDHSVVEAFHQQHIPVVFVDPFLRIPGVPFVACDNFAAAHTATTYLASLGHRHIVHATIEFPLPCIMVGERKLGYREAMRETGLEANAHIHRTTVIPAPHQNNEDAVVDEPKAIREFLDMLDTRQPTACLCFDDLRAAWVMRICHRNGIKIPEDLSIVGTNDEGTATHLWPALTTVRLPSEELGEAAVKMLDELIELGRLSGGGLLLPGTLVERASVKPLRPQEHVESEEAPVRAGRLTRI